MGSQDDSSKKPITNRARLNRLLLRVPLVAWLAIFVVTFGGTVFVFFVTIKAALAPIDDIYENSISFTPVAQQMGSISCKEVYQRIQEGSWHDPNQGRLFARKLITDPTLTVAVHNQSYDPVRWESIYLQGKYYEDEVFSRFVQILSNKKSTKPSLVLDVGANIGFYTLLSATMGYPVVSFEINPANLIRLCESLQLNKKQTQIGFPPVTLFQKGVSNVDGTPLQVLVPKNPGMAFMKELDDTESIQRLHLSANDTTHHAYTTTMTLDTFAKTMGWLTTTTNRNNNNNDWTVAILKLDVEGKEPQIIEGAKQLLQSGRVENVLTEFRRLKRDTIQEAIATLLDAGYTLVDDSQSQSGQRLDRKASQALLDDLAEKYKGKGRNFDFWFQRAP